MRRRSATSYSGFEKHFSYAFVQSGSRNHACPCSKVISPRHTCRHTLDSNWSFTLADQRPEARSVLPSRQRCIDGANWYVHNTRLMLHRYLCQPDAANKANLLALLRDYGNAMERGDVELPMLST